MSNRSPIDELQGNLNNLNISYLNLDQLLNELPNTGGITLDSLESDLSKERLTRTVSSNSNVTLPTKVINIPLSFEEIRKKEEKLEEDISNLQDALTTTKNSIKIDTNQ